MAPRTTYANLPVGLNPLSLFDQSLADMGKLGIIPCTASGTNAIVLTPRADSYVPDIAAYNDGQIYGFVPAGGSTGSVTLRYGALAAKNVYLATGTQAGNGDIASGYYGAVYISTLNSGAGGFYLLPFTAGTGPDPYPQYLTVAEGNAAYQPLDADLTAIAGLTSAADKAPYFTGSGTAALMTVTSQARAVLDDTSYNDMLTTITATRTETGAVASPALTKFRDALSVTDFGAVGDNSTDCTTAFANAATAMTSALRRLYIPGGQYILGNWNLTGKQGFIIQGDGPNVTRLNPKSGMTGNWIDLTGSYQYVIRDMQIGFYNQTPTPDTALFIAQIASGVANQFHLENLYISGKYNYDPLYNFAVPSGSMNNVDIYNYYSGAGDRLAARFTTSNIKSLTSAYQTVNAGGQAVGNITITACEFHKFSGAGGDNAVIEFDGTDSMLLQGGNVTGGATAYVRFKGANTRFTFDTVVNETESEPVTPTYVLYVDTSASLSGLRVGNNYKVVTDAFIGGPGSVDFGSGSQVESFKSIIGTGIVAGATVYIGPGGHSATETKVPWYAPCPGVIAQPLFWVETAPGVGQTSTRTLRKNGADTSITATISGTNKTAYDTTHYVNVAKGDYITDKMVQSGGAATTEAGVSFQFMPTG